MESFKIENFQRNNPGQSFPWVKTLEMDACSVLRARLAGRLGQKENTDPLVLVRLLSERVSNVGHLNHENDNPDLKSIFQSQRIEPSELIYVNWYRFDVIDQMKLLDLCRNLNSIWYPGSDDIDIFDDALNWVVSITHYGSVGVVNFKK